MVRILVQLMHGVKRE